MKGKNSSLIIIILIAVPTLLTSVGIFFFTGMKKYGKPSEYAESLKAKKQAEEDSIMTTQGIIPPENKADSVLTGLDGHEAVLEETNKQEKELGVIQESLDSIKAEKVLIEKKEQSVQEIKAAIDKYLAKATNEKIVSLAKIYDTMKVKQLVPLIQASDDTLAVLTMARMQDRNAGKLLGALAEADVEKATRMNKLFTVLGINFK